MRSARFLINCLPCFLIVLLISGCYSALDPIPVRKGNLITIQKSEPLSNTNEPTLTIHWFGTSSYDIRLGSVAVLTDPFVSYKELLKLISFDRSKNPMSSDPIQVGSKYGNLKKPPRAIFIGHSHYDHMMDTVAALKLKDWRNVPVYGSQTTKHILAGYPKGSPHIPDGLCMGGEGGERAYNWSENWCLSVRSKYHEKEYDWIVIEPDLLSYQSFKATHAHQFAGLTLWNKKLNKDLDKLPTITHDFQVGKTYIHIFELKAPDREGYVSYKVAIVGAATGLDEFGLANKLKAYASKNDLDVLILCVPGWENIKDKKYPGNLLKILKPRVIILTHYDNFFNEDREKDPTRLVPSAKFNEFLNKLQKDIDGISGYDEFESILIPGVGTTLYLNKPPSGVINVSWLSR